MKSSVAFFVLSVLFLSSCYSSKTTISGVNNISYMEIIGDTKFYSNMVVVVLDDKPPISAVVNKNAGGRRNNVYEIKTGLQSVVISYNGIIVFDEKIFTSVNETKRIVLP
jgi:hypothetical protein